MHQVDPPPEDDELSAAPATPAKRRRPELTPAQRALGLLVRREHSRKELKRKLAARGVEAEDAQAAVERMTAEGWQDDGRFAELLVRSRANNGYGPLRIRAELSTHGLDRDIVTAAMDAYDGDAPDRGIQRKAADFLIRRGYSGDQVRAAVRLDDDD